MARGDGADMFGNDSGPTAGSFEARVLGLVPDLRRYCRSLTRSDSDGEDLLHDTVEKALRARTGWNGTNLRAWLFTITTNLYRNGSRHERRFPSTDLDAALELPASDSYGDPLQRRRMQQSLNALSSDHRAVLMLVVVEGYSYQEVATIMDCPIGTVMSRLARAREQLAQQMTSANIIPLRRPE